MKIGVIGGGVVGRATARCFLEHVDEVRVYDVVRARSSHPLGATLSCDLIFVCLPTPQRAGSLECDLSAVEAFFKDLGPQERLGNFVLRSTVPIGTTQRLAHECNLNSLVHSPEFLTARCSFTDAQVPSRMIIGSPFRSTMTPCGHELQELYLRRFPGVPVMVMGSDESEAVKLFLNSFFAVKVAYFNEVYSLAERLGLDWGRIREGMLSDGRIAHAHTQVPGPDGKRGYGGSCLPKDISNLLNVMEFNEVFAPVITGAIARNDGDRHGRPK